MSVVVVVVFPSSVLLSVPKKKSSLLFSGLVFVLAPVVGYAPKDTIEAKVRELK